MSELTTTQAMEDDQPYGPRIMSEHKRMILFAEKLSQITFQLTEYLNDVMNYDKESLDIRVLHCYNYYNDARKALDMKLIDQEQFNNLEWVVREFVNHRTELLLKHAQKKRPLEDDDVDSDVDYDFEEEENKAKRQRTDQGDNDISMQEA